MKTKAYFTCSEKKTDAEYQLNEIRYYSDENTLLEVTLDPNYLKSKSPKKWKQLFDHRLNSIQFPYNSGVWNKKEWVLPDISLKNIISLGEGNTPLLESKKFTQKLGVKSLWIKQCGISHTGSFKDLGMTVLVSQVNQMIAEGKNIKAIACASTGDTSAALSSYAAWAGIPSIVFLPKDKISISQLIQPISNASLVFSLDTDFDGCMQVVKEITTQEGIYLANSMNSLRLEGQKTISMEICQQLGWKVPDWIIIPGGNLGNISALGKGFKEMKLMGLIKDLPRIAVAQAKNANPLYLSYSQKKESIKPIQAKKTQASAIQIGNPVSAKKAIKVLKELNGVVEQVSEKQLANSAAIGDFHGFFNCPQTGVALGAFINLIEKKIISKKEKIVIISTAHGLKFSEFKINYHTNNTKSFKPKFANEIIKLPKDLDLIKKTLKKKLNP